MKSERLPYELRASALAGYRSALRVVAFTLLWVPIGALINVIFDHEAKTNWKLSLEVGGTLAVLWYGVTFFSTLFDLRKQGQSETARNPSFPASSFLSGLCGVTAIFSVWLIWGLHSEGDPVWLQLLPLAFLGIAFFAWPRTIHCDQESVWQRDRWGRKKNIPYNEIQSISGAGGTTTVLGPKAVIEHTSQHIDPESFRHAVSLRSGKPIY
jgi:hypothetical protein